MPIVGVLEAGSVGLHREACRPAGLHREAARNAGATMQDSCLMHDSIPSFLDDRAQRDNETLSFRGVKTTMRRETRLGTVE